MEGLMSAGIKLNPIHSFCSRQQNSLIVPSLAPRVTRRVLISPTGVMRSPKSFNSVAASVQPLEASAPGRFDNTLPSKEVLEVWRNASAVCFDVDSTVCLDEGIDELAEFCGAGEAVAEWTARAMSGSVPFEQALAARLSLFNPSLSQVQEFLEKRPPRLSPGIDALVKKLKDKNKIVYLVSGGFRQMINPVASILGIPLRTYMPINFYLEALGSSWDLILTSQLQEWRESHCCSTD
ncbi:hypothetical protein Pfo_020556 [Paulownia fortunei]|nr:hypothetical protein Pfo_020556 [Paulownia fortunei]